MLNARGWAALIVDSHGPRGYLDYDVWRLICAGQLFMGSERAADVLVSIYDARRMPFVDPERHGADRRSHGGWAVMELLAFEAARRLPSAWPRCPGDMAQSRWTASSARSWSIPIAVRRTGRAAPAGAIPRRSLFLLSADDMIAPADDLPGGGGDADAAGVPVETVVFEGVTHGFDQMERAALSPLEFDAEATAEALRVAPACSSTRTSGDRWLQTRQHGQPAAGLGRRSSQSC